MIDYSVLFSDDVSYLSTCTCIPLSVHSIIKKNLDEK